MKTYGEYKKTDFHLIDKIPKDWSINLFKRGISDLTDYEANGSFTSVKANVRFADTEDQEYAWYVRATDLEKKSYNDYSNLRWVDENTYDFLSRTKLTGGELLIAKRGEIGKIYLMPFFDEPCTLAPNLYLLRFNKKINPYFAHYYFQSYAGNEELKSKDRSTTIGAVYKDDLKSIKFIYPTSSEQTQIANYLDHKTQIIDALIEKKEQLIKKLQAQRQAIINEAVTKGLNPNIKMKDSGIEWLGEIPEHWEVSRLDYMSEIIDPQPDHRAPKIDENGLPYLGIRDINPDGSINTETARTVELAAIEKQERSFTIEEGDIVFGKVGTLANPKHIKLGGNRVALSATLVLIKTNSTLYNEFLKYSLDSEFIWNQINTVIVGATRPALGIQQIRKFKIIKPSDEDMLEIVSFLKSRTSLINNLLKLNKKYIKRLKSYRQSIISEAVTGKIDVRDWQPKKQNA